MPQGYVKLRNAFQREGLSLKAAQEKAAKIWNKRHPGNTVGRGRK